MNISQLKNFIAVCDAGSISRAAQTLYISKQGLSRSIRSLEEELQQTLFFRTPAGITLTDAGETALHHARQIVRSSDDMLHALERQTGAEKLLLAFPNGFFACLPVDIVYSFMAANPDILCKQVCFKDSEMHRGFLEQGVDLALCSGPRDEETFDYYPLFRNRRCLYVNRDHPFAGRESVSVDELRDQQIGVPASGYYDTPFLIEQCRERGFVPRLFQCEGLDMLLQYARLGMGPALAVDNLDPESVPGDLCAVHFASSAFNYDVYMMTLCGNDSPAVMKFIDHARQYCARLQQKPGREA